MTSTKIATQAHSVATSSIGGSVARAGLVARGVIYLLIGWVALMLALGRSNKELDQGGALQTLAGKRGGPRIKSAFRGVVYTFFALTTVSVLHGSGSSQAGKQQDVTARVMKHTGGRLAIGIVGGIVLILGLSLIMEGLRRKFVKTLRTGEMTHRTRSVVVALGVVGTTARGIIF